MESLPHSFSIEDAFNRNQLALSILGHRRDSEAVEQAVAALKGAPITDLTAPEGEA